VRGEIENLLILAPPEFRIAVVVTAEGGSCVINRFFEGANDMP
jgi:hypothetical protein